MKDTGCFSSGGLLDAEFAVASFPSIACAQPTISPVQGSVPFLLALACPHSGWQTPQSPHTSGSARLCPPRQASPLFLEPCSRERPSGSHRSCWFVASWPLVQTTFSSLELARSSLLFPSTRPVARLSA